MCDYCNKGYDIEFIGYREDRQSKCHRCEVMGHYVLTQLHPIVHLCHACAKEYHKRHADMLDKFLVSDCKGDQQSDRKGDICI